MSKKIQIRIRDEHKQPGSYFRELRNHFCWVKILKGTVSRDFLLLVFLWISFLPAPEYPIRTVSNFFNDNFSTTLAANFATRFASVVYTGGKFATGVNDTSDKFAAGVNDTGGNLQPVSTTLAANLPPVSLTPVQIGTTLGCWDLKVNLKAKKYIYKFTLLPKGVQTI